MNEIHHEDFDSVLKSIKDNVKGNIEFDKIRSIESNFDTKGMMFKSRDNSISNGTIIVGEDNGAMAVDISRAEGDIISFVLEDKNDKQGIENIVNWLYVNYK